MRTFARRDRFRSFGFFGCACAFFLVGGWLYSLSRLNEQHIEPRPCLVADEMVVRRQEAYVQQHIQQLATEAGDIEAGPEPLDLAIYGDSIAETWRGTDMGRKCGRCQGGPEVFEKFFASRYRAHVFAVGGDQTGHLQWRLLHGELMVQNSPKVAVLMIGTNDLGAAASCLEQNSSATADTVQQVFLRIEKIIHFLRTHTPSTKVVVMGLPPRGVWSPEEGVFAWPSVFTNPIEALNHILRMLAAGQELVHYVDCGSQLLRDGKIDRDLQGDGLHPTKAGLAVLASCLLSAVEGILGPGTRPSFLDAHPLRHWIRDQAASGSFWGA